MKVRVQNKKYFDQLELEANNGVQISNIVQTESPITFTLKNEGDGQVLGHEINETQIIDGLNVIPCKAKSININIYLIKRLGGRAFNVNRAAISAYLKDFMKTINITTNINFIEKEIDYKEFDTNGDGIIFKPDPKNEDFKNEASYLSKYQFEPNVEAFRVVILDNIRIGRPELSENEFVAGYAGTGFRANYAKGSIDWTNESQSVIASTFAPTGTIKPNLNTTLMHELGHFIFGLSHPFEQFKSQGFTPSDDEKNIMDYTKPNSFTTDKERKLKAYQVIGIENLLIED